MIWVWWHTTSAPTFDWRFDYSITHLKPKWCNSNSFSTGIHGTCIWVRETTACLGRYMHSDMSYSCFVDVSFVSISAPAPKCSSCRYTKTNGINTNHISSNPKQQQILCAIVFTVFPFPTRERNRQNKNFGNRNEDISCDATRKCGTKKKHPQIQARKRSVATTRRRGERKWFGDGRKKCGESEGETLKIETHTNMIMARGTEKDRGGGAGLYIILLFSSGTCTHTNEPEQIHTQFGVCYHVDIVFYFISIHNKMRWQFMIVLLYTHILCRLNQLKHNSIYVYGYFSL